MADERFKQEDAGSYDSAATSFHRLSSVYSAPFADELVRLAGVGRDDQVLDLGAGTGIIADRVDATGARCIAADLSHGMLRVAAQRFPAVRMDADAFAIRQESFDAVIALFAIVHFPDPSAVLRACRDSLRPGGVLAFAYGAPAPWPTAVLRLPRYVADQVRRRTGRLLTAPQALHERLLHGEREQETRRAASDRGTCPSYPGGGLRRPPNWLDRPPLRDPLGRGLLGVAGRILFQGSKGARRDGGALTRTASDRLRSEFSSRARPWRFAHLPRRGRLDPRNEAAGVECKAQ